MVLPNSFSLNLCRWNKNKTAASSGVFFAQSQCFMINFYNFFLKNECLESRLERFSTNIISIIALQLLALSIYQGWEAKYKKQDVFLNHLMKIWNCFLRPYTGNAARSFREKKVWLQKKPLKRCFFGYCGLWGYQCRQRISQNVHRVTLCMEKVVRWVPDGRREVDSCGNKLFGTSRGTIILWNFFQFQPIKFQLRTMKRKISHFKTLSVIVCRLTLWSKLITSNNRLIGTVMKKCSQ